MKKEERTQYLVEIKKVTIQRSEIKGRKCRFALNQVRCTGMLMFPDNRQVSLGLNVISGMRGAPLCQFYKTSPPLCCCGVLY